MKLGWREEEESLYTWGEWKENWEGSTWSKSTDWVRMRFMRSRTADSTTARVGSVDMKTHHLVAPTTDTLGGSDSLNCPWNSGLDRAGETSEGYPTKRISALP